jgi:double-stranded uracil-DNA glycosylase
MSPMKSSTKNSTKSSTKKSTTKPPKPPDPITGAWTPTKEQLAKATRKRVPDLIAPNLDVLFCGINPGTYSAAVGHHFAGPGSRFWITLRDSKLTPRLYSAFEEDQLLALGYGITNIVPRASTTADDLSPDELRAGGKRLRKLVFQYQPRFLAFLGFVAYRTAFKQPKAIGGLQLETIGATQIWLLPNPSGLNAHHQDSGLAKLFAELQVAANVPRATPAFDHERNTVEANSEAAPRSLQETPS